MWSEYQEGGIVSHHSQSSVQFWYDNILMSPAGLPLPPARPSPSLHLPPSFPCRATLSWCSGRRSCAMPIRKPSSCCRECPRWSTSHALQWWSWARSHWSSAAAAAPMASDLLQLPVPSLIYLVGFVHHLHPLSRLPLCWLLCCQPQPPEVL